MFLFYFLIRDSVSDVYVLKWTLDIWTTTKLDTVTWIATQTFFLFGMENENFKMVKNNETYFYSMDFSM